MRYVLMIFLSLGLSLSCSQKKPLVVVESPKKTETIRVCESKILPWVKYFDQGEYLTKFKKPTPKEFYRIVKCGELMLEVFDES